MTPQPQKKKTNKWDWDKVLSIIQKFSATGVFAVTIKILMVASAIYTKVNNLDVAYNKRFLEIEGSIRDAGVERHEIKKLVEYHDQTLFKHESEIRFLLGPKNILLFK